MADVITEHSGSILRVELNRPAKRNAMTSGMYTFLADIFNAAAKHESTRVVLWHGVGESLSAGNDVDDFLKNRPGPGDSPQARLMSALIDLDKPLVAAVQGAAIGGGTTMLSTVTSFTPARVQSFKCLSSILRWSRNLDRATPFQRRSGHIRAAELILLGLPFGARRAMELGFVTQVVPDQSLLATATETVRTLAAKPICALQASKRLMKRPFREKIKAAMEAENQEFSVRVRSEEAREALGAFLEKRRLPAGVLR